MAREQQIELRHGSTEYIEEKAVDEAGNPVTGGTATVESVTPLDAATGGMSTIKLAVTNVDMPEIGATGVYRYTVPHDLLETEYGLYDMRTKVVDATGEVVARAKRILYVVPDTD